MFVECFKKAFWKSKIKVFISHHTGVSATDVYGREGGDLHMTCLAGARDRFVSWYAVSSSEVLIAYGSRVSPQFPDVTVDHRPSEAVYELTIHHVNSSSSVTSYKCSSPSGSSTYVNQFYLNIAGNLFVSCSTSLVIG